MTIKFMIWKDLKLEHHNLARIERVEFFRKTAKGFKARPEGSTSSPWFHSDSNYRIFDSHDEAEAALQDMARDKLQKVYRLQHEWGLILNHPRSLR